MEPEYFQYLLLMLLTIARFRPENLRQVAVQVAAGEQVDAEKEKEKEKEEGEEKDKGDSGEVEEDKGEKAKVEEKEGGGEKEEEGSHVSEESEVDMEATVEASAEDQTKQSDVDNVIVFLDLFNKVFWDLFARRPAGPTVAPVVNPGECVSGLLQ